VPFAPEDRNIGRIGVQVGLWGILFGFANSIAVFSFHLSSISVKLRSNLFYFAISYVMASKIA
jgi:hypothetical protein